MVWNKSNIEYSLSYSILIWAPEQVCIDFKSKKGSKKSSKGTKVHRFGHEIKFWMLACTPFIDA
jgi:hypothetical protein